MLRFLQIVSLFLILIGCTSQYDEYTVETVISQTGHDVVPIEEALGQLYAVQSMIIKETRSDVLSNRMRSIRDISVCGGSSATRSTGGNLPDTMVYVVNFEDNQGFAVLGARRSFEPVYIITETGSFNADKLNDAIARAQVRRQQDGNTKSVTQGGNIGKVSDDIGTDYAYELLGGALAAAAPRIAVDVVFIGYTDWRLTKIVGPLVEVKWGQEYPFNMAMPVNTTINKYLYQGKSPVGCGPIAAAQLMAAVRKPAMAPGDMTTYSWSNLRSISNYTNTRDFASLLYHPDSVGYNVHVLTLQLADFLYHIGKCFKAVYWPTSTPILSCNIVDGLILLDPEYYGKAEWVKVDSYVLNRMYLALDKNKPLLTDGSCDDGGHMWITDGYIQYTREAQYRYVFPTGTLGQIISKIERNYLLHLNWGYRGHYDGYYAAGIFDMNQRLFKDEVIDANSKYIGTDNFNRSIGVMFY